jgi:micrococcal nuclease
MRYFSLSLLLFLSIVALRPAQAESLTGRAVVVDGDSLVVDGTRIRMWGIDAPEMGTRAGGRAKEYLRALIAGHEVRCEDNGLRVAGRIMAQCFLGTVELGRVMMLSGNAQEWRRHARGYYRRMLKEAGIPERRFRQVARRPAKQRKPQAAAWRARRTAPFIAAPADAADAEAGPAVTAEAARPAPEARSMARPPEASSGSLEMENLPPVRAAPRLQVGPPTLLKPPAPPADN